MIYDYDSSTLTETIDIRNSLFTNPILTEYSKMEYRLNESIIIIQNIINESTQSIISTMIEAGEEKSSQNNTATSQPEKIVIVPDKAIDNSKTKFNKNINIKGKQDKWDKFVEKVKNIISAMVRFVKTYATKIAANSGMYEKWLNSNLMAIEKQLQKDDFTRKYEINASIRNMITVMHGEPAPILGCSKVVANDIKDMFRQLGNDLSATVTSVDTVSNGLVDEKYKKISDKIYKGLGTVIINNMPSERSDVSTCIRDITKDLAETTPIKLSSADIKACIDALKKSNQMIKSNSGRTLSEYNDIINDYNKFVQTASRYQINSKTKSAVDNGEIRKDNSISPETIQSMVNEINNKFLKLMNDLNKFMYFVVTKILNTSFKVLAEFIKKSVSKKDDKDNESNDSKE